MKNITYVQFNEYNLLKYCIFITRYGNVFVIDVYYHRKLLVTGRTAGKI